jgi:hypothetical protein
MGVRQSLNENKKLGVGVGAGIFVVAIAIVSFQLFGDGGSGIEAPTSAFYTDDDGKTFFKDDAYKVVPFDHGGKQAYRADVFKCADGKQFVGLMYRHNAVGRKAMEEHIAKGAKDPDGSFLTGLDVQGTEVKRAGAPNSAWTPNVEPETIQRSVKCASGDVPALVNAK